MSESVDEIMRLSQCQQVDCVFDRHQLSQATRLLNDLFSSFRPMGAREITLRKEVDDFLHHRTNSMVEPDMTRMGDKHIKPCRGANCSELILWAKCVKKDGSIGLVAPLVKAKEGETPNIMAWYDESEDQWFYKVKGAKSEIRGVAEYVNHHMNCASKGQFKSNLNEREERQAAIK